VLKTVGTTTTLFVYDQVGHLIGEYNGSTPVEETIWLGDMPVAIQEPSGTYYIHADYRNVPRQIDNAKKQVLWAWDPYVFGDTNPDQNPPGLPFSTFTYNLRFPGQYYDAESGNFYNYFRDYNPALGRYQESDPSGLGGGINTYAYVKGNPLNLVDPLGLMGSRGYLPPPPPEVSPALKNYLCKLIKQCHGDFNCVFNTVNDARRNQSSSNGPADPKAWNDPTLRNAENFAAAASADALPYAYATDSAIGIWSYQYIVKPYIYPLVNKRTTPVSDDAYKAGIAGSYWDGKTPAEAMKWCDKCGNQ
jgi:RHS repeat-associated protein